MSQLNQYNIRLRKAESQGKPYSLAKEIGWTVAGLVAVIVAAAIGGFFISQPHTGDWGQEWLRYALWLAVGIPILCYAVVGFINDGRSSAHMERVNTGLPGLAMMFFWVLATALLIGYLISLPHTRAWFGNWMTISAVSLLGLVIVLGGIIFGNQDPLESLED